MSPSPTVAAKQEITFTVNGTAHTVHAYPMARLLDALREELHLTGTKEGCGEGECGSCSVLLDGILVNSCLVPVLHANGANILTIEGLACDHRLHPLQQAFLQCGAAQCGICTPGMVLAAVHSAEQNSSANAGRNPRRFIREPLPLHRLHADFRGGCASRGGSNRQH